MEEEYIKLKDIKKDNKKAKVKKIFNQVGTGAKKVGKGIVTGTKTALQKGYEKYKKYNDPEAKIARIESQIKQNKLKAKLAQSQKELRESQGGSGRSILAGFGGMDMGGDFRNFSSNTNNALNNVSSPLQINPISNNNPISNSFGLLPQNRVSAVKRRYKYRYITIKKKPRKLRNIKIRRRVYISNKKPKKSYFNPFNQF